MKSNDPIEIPRDSLEWLATEKLLELIAHDINNICHAALSYIDLASDASQPPEARAKFLALSRALVHRASRFAPHVRTLHELRTADVARLASDPLAEVVDAAVAKVHDVNPGISFELKRTGDAWERRVVGGKFVTHAVADLLDNAVRFARPGTPPEAEVGVTGDGAFVRITVTDNGRAFSQGQDAYAAKRFSQAGSVSGAGIGLATARLLAERTGGSLHLSSGPRGKGAVVVLTLLSAPSADAKGS